jgi:hypothetical protein
MIREHLTHHAQEGRDGLLFPAANGGHLAPSTPYKSFYRARHAAGRPDLRWHDLRHSGAVLAAQTGATLAELTARLGHSTQAPRFVTNTQHKAVTWKSRRHLRPWSPCPRRDSRTAERFRRPPHRPCTWTVVVQADFDSLRSGRPGEFTYRLIPAASRTRTGARASVLLQLPRRGGSSAWMPLAARRRISWWPGNPQGRE